LPIPHFYSVFFSLICPVLHRIAFPVVSEWCQKQVNDTSLPPLQVRLGKRSLGGGFARKIASG